MSKNYWLILFLNKAPPYFIIRNHVEAFPDIQLRISSIHSNNNEL
jgi:hypothetical protein